MSDQRGAQAVGSKDAGGSSSIGTVYVVDDEPAVCRALQRLFQHHAIAVRTFHSAQEFLEAWHPDMRGCLVLDARMPGMSGLELQRELVKRGIRMPVIFLTGSADVPMAVEALRAGAVDFLEKPFENDVLLERVRQALTVGEARSREQQRRAEVEQRIARLTPRERQVMERMVAGEPSKVIAHRLGMSPRTVEVHRARIMDKMQVKSLAELVRATLNLSEPQ